MINWKVRVRQKWFWLTIIPAVLMLLDQLWGLFAVLGSILGIPVDTTTEGYGDSARALTYEEPAPNASAYGLQEYEEQCAAAAAKSVKFNTGEFIDAVKEAEDGHR